MLGNQYVFQISGQKDLRQKAEMLQAIRQLQGHYIGGSVVKAAVLQVYNEAVTHLITSKPPASEKFLAACAAGKWIVTPQFVLDSVKNRAWLPEAPYELNLIATIKDPVTTNPLQTWREKVARGITSGAFQPLCSSLNWSIHWNKPSQPASCVRPEVMECASITVQEEPRHVTDNSVLLQLEETLLGYITRIESLLECSLFSQALEELQGWLHPGVLPPASVLHECMQHALHGEAEPYFLGMFNVVLNDILCNNPTWNNPKSVKYFLKILQCPQCEAGVWPFLQTSVRVSLGSPATCHSLPSPASPELLHFHGNLQAFILRLFQLELHAMASAGRAAGSRGSVIYSMFWNVWEKMTLSSKALQQLVKLLVETTLWALHSSEKRRLRVLGTLQEILAAVVEYWAQEHTRLNSRIVQKGFQDLAEHMAILCQDLHPDTLRELVPALLSHRLRMLTADAIYRNICISNGLLLHPEPLSLHKIDSHLLTLLSMRVLSHHSVSQHFGGSGSPEDTEKNVPKGFYRVNSAGETLLHRACKRNQVETVLQILGLPDVDVNVKDHAGWTPLHEACNHGSSECVRALLQHCPGLQLDSQVEGVSPLHDALRNQHTHIAKMLLRHAGSVLLQLRDSSGHTPLDLVSSAALHEKLMRCAEERDAALAVQSSEVRDMDFVETCSCLLSCLLLTYLAEQHIPSYERTDPVLEFSSSAAHTLLRLSRETLHSHCTNAKARALAHDLRTLMRMEQYVKQLSPALIHCAGTHTCLLIQLLKDLQAEGKALLRGKSEL
ncbi:SMC5-SMC6 complex localization factor protein 1 [Bagarius yarrelli]|uniref:SMC5-SMC6 complex localization factor protein 1 n=1 Tax=Bagarius yarrelli TaxID=175774 RepID=A0A556V3A1_BAGYA|nr:SMC5-SMC6 complex localization factor protein 1 [Bagarius yarrelli]